MIFGSLAFPNKKNSYSSKNIETENLISDYYIIEVLVILGLIVSYLLMGPQSNWFISIVSWKFLWKATLISVFILFIIMILKFTLAGYKDIKDMLRINND